MVTWGGGWWGGGEELQRENSGQGEGRWVLFFPMLKQLTYRFVLNFIKVFTAEKIMYFILHCRKIHTV